MFVKAAHSLTLSKVSLGKKCIHQAFTTFPAESKVLGCGPVSDSAREAWIMETQIWCRTQLCPSGRQQKKKKKKRRRRRGNLRKQTIHLREEVQQWVKGRGLSGRSRTIWWGGVGGRRARTSEQTKVRCAGKPAETRV